jgi:MFS-type transporter involved in bile tolerance (Atg22 family)
MTFLFSSIFSVLRYFFYTPASVVLRGPNDQHLCMFFGFCWGLSLGWLQPQNTSAYIPLLPPTNRSQNTEMMGFYLLACQILSWLPPTVFTIMNELHISMSYGLGSLSVYFMISMLFLCRIGDYNHIVASHSGGDNMVLLSTLPPPIATGTADGQPTLVHPNEKDTIVPEMNGELT